MTYALGRRVEHYDMPAIRAIVRDAAKNDYKMSSFHQRRHQERGISDGTGPPRGGARGRRRGPLEHPARFGHEVRDVTVGSEENRFMFITQKHMSRRQVLKGVGVTVALPLLDAMVPARGWAQAARPKVRLAAIEMVHGSAGATKFGAEKNMWSPAQVGRNYDLTPSSLSPLEGFRDHLTIISNTDVRNAEAFEAPEIGGDHFRSSAVFLTQMHPRQTQGSDVRVGTSLDQYYAQKYRAGHRDPIAAALYRERGSGGRLLLRLLVRLHRLDQLGCSRRAAADGARSAHGLRHAVRCWRHATGPCRAPARGPQHPRLDQRGHDAPPQHAWRLRSRAAERRISKTSARSSGVFSASKPRTRRVSRASCRARRSGCPIRSKSTSS